MIIYLLLFAGIALSLFAQFKVQRNFKKYSEVMSKSNMTGAAVAKLILDRSGVTDVNIQPVAGVLNDHYDPRTKTVRLSEEVYNKTSIAAVSVAAHEVGHAIQHNEEYAFLNFRSLLAPVAGFASKFVYILVFAGFAFRMLQLVDLGIIAFSLALLFQIITLPVEFNASNRAINSLQDYGIIANDEVALSKKVLSSAALTYVAAASVSALELARLILIRNSRRR